MEVICDYIRDRTIEYKLWVNDLGMFGTDIPHFQILPNNYLKCMLRRDIKESGVTQMSGKRLDDIISACLRSLQNVYMLKLKYSSLANVVTDSQPPYNSTVQ